MLKGSVQEVVKLGFGIINGFQLSTLLQSLMTLNNLELAICTLFALPYGEKRESLMGKLKILDFCSIPVENFLPSFSFCTHD
jgi:hypothetical protein